MPIDDRATSAADPAQDLAADLRALRAQAGSPSLRSIAAAIGTVSHTTVAEALSGKRTPSWPAVAAVITQLGGDEQAFRSRWVAATSESPAPTAPEREDVLFISRYRRLIDQYYNTLQLFGTAEPRSHFNDLYVLPSMTKVSAGETNEKTAKVDFLHFDQKIRRTLLIGAPGSGKSTLCKALVRRHALDENLPPAFLVQLSEFAATFPPERSVVGFIEHNLESVFQIRPPEGLMEHRLLREPTLVIFDGLDALVGDDRQAHVASILGIFSSNFPLAKVLVTSRDIAYHKDFFNPGIFATYRLEDFSTKEAFQYAQKWYEIASGDSSTETAKSWAQELLSQSSAVTELRRTPLIWAILCSQYWQRNDISTNMLDLYGNVWDELLSNRLRRTSYPLHLQEVARQLLQHVAFVMLRSKRTDVSSGEFIQTATEYLRPRYGNTNDAEQAAREILDFYSHAGIFTSLGFAAGGETYGFFHQSFMEYSASYYLAYHIRDPQEIASEIISQAARGDSSDLGLMVIQLAARQGSQGSSILACLLDEASRLIGDQRASILELLDRCRQDIELPPSVDARIISTINEGNEATHGKAQIVTLQESMRGWMVSKAVPKVVFGELETIREVLLSAEVEPHRAASAIIWGWATLEDCLRGILRAADDHDGGVSKFNEHSGLELAMEAESRGLLAPGDTGKLTTVWRLRSTMAHGPQTCEAALTPAVVDAIEAIHRTISHLYDRAGSRRQAS